ARARARTLVLGVVGLLVAAVDLVPRDPALEHERVLAVLELRVGDLDACLLEGLGDVLLVVVLVLLLLQALLAFALVLPAVVVGAVVAGRALVVALQELLVAERELVRHLLVALLGIGAGEDLAAALELLPEEPRLELAERQERELARDLAVVRLGRGEARARQALGHAAEPDAHD